MAATVAGANAYFAERLGTDAWDGASDTDKQKALAQAERELRAGDWDKRASGSNLTFAVYEQALWLLGDDPRAALQQSGVTSTRISDGGATETYQASDPHIAPKALYYLRKARRGPVKLV